MGLILAATLLAGFVVNVSLGSISGSAPLGNVAEMVILFSASIAFVADVLRREARAKSSRSDN